MFAALFSGLYIGKSPTPERGKYAVIQFDFSGLNTESHEEFKRSFSDRVQENVNPKFSVRIRMLFKNLFLKKVRLTP
ncbi:MAG: AAA family ATPase [Chitinispirillales bacterium]|nr:AAA family ATPase [Chitinispirillales bacterium]